MREFELPKNNVLIAFSGGRTSAYMLHKIIEANNGLPSRVIVSFQNTGREMPQTLDFVNAVSSRWNVQIKWLEYRPYKPWFESVSHHSASRSGEPFDYVIAKRKMLPNIAMRFCTQELKILTARRYCRSIGWKNWTVARGIRFDEADRATESKDKRITHWHPLVDAGCVKADVEAFWRSQPFGLELPYLAHGNPFGNCDGCFLKSEASKALLMKDHPSRAQWWIDQENKMQATFRNGCNLSELKDYINSQGEFAFSDGVLCQANEGECI